MSGDEESGGRKYPGANCPSISNILDKAENFQKTVEEEMPIFEISQILVNCLFDEEMRAILCGILTTIDNSLIFFKFKVFRKYFYVHYFCKLLENQSLQSVFNAQTPKLTKPSLI